MVGASWRLARTMLGEVGAKMGPRSTKIAQDGSKIEKKRFRRRSWGRPGAKLGPIIFSKTRPEARGMGKGWLAFFAEGSAGGRGVAPGRVRVGKSPPGLVFRIRYGCLTRRSST